jgi:beta-N-acetylhexosaminidase
LNANKSLTSHFSHNRWFTNRWFELTLILCLILLPACIKRESNINTPPINEEETIIIDHIKTRAAEIAASMDDNLLAAQVIISGIDGRGSLPDHIKELLTECPPGGVMLFRYNLDTDNNSISSLITETDSLILKEAGIPPFIAVDLEGGTVNRLRGNTQLPAAGTLPAASSYWELYLSQGKQAALEKIEEDSRLAGAEISALGINMNFAPVAEHLHDDNLDFMLSRSYGPNLSFTGEAAAAFIRGMENSNILCVAKHFPGSAGADPHYSISVLNKDKTTLDNFVSPFSTLIKNGARAIMAAHTLVPEIDDKIASLSSIVMQNWLRDELGFDGIIISDDFIMEAAGDLKPEEVAVLSIAAGADMILVWPQALLQTHNAILTALEEGRLSRQRLQEAVTRIIYEKICLGLM